jgi:hypothetical protein
MGVQAILVLGRQSLDELIVGGLELFALRHRGWL